MPATADFGPAAEALPRRAPQQHPGNLKALLDALASYGTTEDHARRCRIAAHNPQHFPHVAGTALTARHNIFSYLPPPQAETLLAEHQPQPGPRCCACHAPGSSADANDSLADYLTLPSGEVKLRQEVVGARTVRLSRGPAPPPGAPPHTFELSCRVLGTADGADARGSASSGGGSSDAAAGGQQEGCGHYMCERHLIELQVRLLHKVYDCV